MDIVSCIADLFERHGGQAYEGNRREPVSALEHALQCAQLAEWSDAEATLVAAAFLHDIGHFLVAEAITRDDRIDDRHEEIAIPFLAAAFDASVLEPIRLHVPAKRCLVRTDEHYARSLSPASVSSLALQGGPMRDDELEQFFAQPYSRQALMLRRWDDLAKQPGRTTPSIDWYLGMLQALLEQPRGDQRTSVGATGVT